MGYKKDKNTFYISNMLSYLHNDKKKYMYVCLLNLKITEIQSLN